MTHGSGSFLTPGAWLARFIKRTTLHCYIQNMKALDPRCGAIFDHRGMVGRIYKEDHYIYTATYI